MKLSKELEHFKKTLSKVSFLGKDDAMKALDTFIKKSKENEELVDKAIDALGNCNEDICPCVEDVLSYLEAIKENE